MNTKLKSLCKIACYATAVVIFCYLEGRFNLIDKISGKSEMAGRRILSAEFEVFGIVQGENKITLSCLRWQQMWKIIEIGFFRCFLSKGNWKLFCFIWMSKLQLLMNCRILRIKLNDWTFVAGAWTRKKELSRVSSKASKSILLKCEKFNENFEVKLFKQIFCRKHWLTNTGSSQSRIDKAVFSDPKELSEFSFPSFEIRRVRRNWKWFWIC